ncbi:hypothetical protein HDU96_000173, partial [Phlyctochytrium bullatum]
FTSTTTTTTDTTATTTTATRCIHYQQRSPPASSSPCIPSSPPPSPPPTRITRRHLTDPLAAVIPHRRNPSLSSVGSAATLLAGRRSSDGQRSSPLSRPLVWDGHGDPSHDDIDDDNEGEVLYGDFFAGKKLDAHPASSEFFQQPTATYTALGHDTTLLHHLRSLLLQLRHASIPNLEAGTYRPVPSASGPKRVTAAPKRLARTLLLTACLVACLTGLTAAALWAASTTTSTPTAVPTDATPATPANTSHPLQPTDRSPHPLVYLSRARHLLLQPLRVIEAAHARALAAHEATLAALPPNTTDLPTAPLKLSFAQTFPYASLPSHLGQDVLASSLVPMCGSPDLRSRARMVLTTRWGTTAPPADRPDGGLTAPYPVKLKFFSDSLESIRVSTGFKEHEFEKDSVGNDDAWKVLEDLHKGVNGSASATPTGLVVRRLSDPEPLAPASSRFACGSLSDASDLVERYCVTRNVALDPHLVMEAFRRLDGGPEPSFSDHDRGSPGGGRDHRLRSRFGRPQAPHPDDTPRTGYATRQGEVDPPLGAVVASCGLDEEKWFGGNMFGKGAAGWLFAGTHVQDPNDASNASAPVRCAAWIDTPLFFVSRWDTTNPYQAHQDLLNAFRVYAALGLSADAVQPVLLDTRVRDGPFVAAWASVFGGGRRVLDVVELVGAAGGTEGARVCLRTAVWGVHGGISPLARNGGWAENAGVESPLVRGFAAFVLDRVRQRVLGDKAGASVLVGELERREDVNATEAREEKPSVPLTPRTPLPVPEELRIPEDNEGPVPRVIKVTYAIRRSTTAAAPQHPSVLDDTLEGLEGLNATSSATPLGLPPTIESRLSRRAASPQLLRTLTNEPDLVSALRTAVEAWTPPPTELDGTLPSFKASFRAVDFATLSFQDQLAVAQDTDVFVGPHGAVFAFLMYLRRVDVEGVFNRTEAIAELFPSLADVLRTPTPAWEPHPGIEAHPVVRELVPSMKTDPYQWAREDPADAGAGGTLELQPPERSVGNHQFRNLARRTGLVFRKLEVGSARVEEAQVREAERLVGEVVREVWVRRVWAGRRRG